MKIKVYVIAIEFIAIRFLGAVDIAVKMLEF